MNTVLVVLTVIVSILLIIVVLIQKSKGGGLASNFAGSNQVLGVNRTNNFIEKTTWVLAIIILVLSVLSSFASSNKTDEHKGNLKVEAPVQQQAADYGTSTPAAAATPVATPAATPAPAPAAQQ